MKVDLSNYTTKTEKKTNLASLKAEVDKWNKTHRIAWNV